MDNRELAQEATTLRLKGLPFPLYTCEMQLRLAMAADAAVICAVGDSAGSASSGAVERSIGFGLSLLVVLVYYVLVMGGVGIAQRGVWPVIPSVWFANTVIALVGLGLGWRMLKQ